MTRKGHMFLPDFIVNSLFRSWVNFGFCYCYSYPCAPQFSNSSRITLYIRCGLVCQSFCFVLFTMFPPSTLSIPPCICVSENLSPCCWYSSSSSFHGVQCLISTPVKQVFTSYLILQTPLSSLGFQVNCLHYNPNFLMVLVGVVILQIILLFYCKNRNVSLWAF